MTASRITLSQALDFDHVIEVMADRTFSATPAARALYVPEAIDVDPYATTLEDWELPLSGFTGQYGYDGPWLHDSEVIEGGVEDYVLAHPGFWVAIYGQHTDENNLDDFGYPETGIEGWTLAFKASEVSA